MNCWEYMDCGREEGGACTDEHGVCPAYPDHGTHCARVAGTYCDGPIQGSFARKLRTCVKCAFYKSEHHDQEYPALLVTREDL